MYPPATGATGRAEGRAGELEALTQAYMVPFAGYSGSKGGCKRLRVRWEENSSYPIAVLRVKRLPM